MSVIRIATRYAKSLLDLAVENNKLDPIYSDILYFEQVTQSREFVLMLKSPIIKADKKVSIIKTIFEGKIDSITYSFFEIIVKKTRENYLPEIAAAFVDQYNLHKGIRKAKITTASAIDETLKASIEKTILESTDSKQIDLETVVDDEIIGGFVLQYDDKLFDASVARKLDLLKKEFNKNTYIKRY